MPTSSAAHSLHTLRQAVALILAVFAAALIASTLFYHATAAPTSPPLPSSLITLSAPEPYLGVGNDDAVLRSGDPTMRMQGMWLSIHWPGTEKQFGDPYNAKWDTLRGFNWPPGNGQTQPDYDPNGHDFFVYTPAGTTGYLQIYDPAYQSKVRSPFDPTHPCGDGVYHAQPYTCFSSGPDYNNINSLWCTSNSFSSGDNQPGAPNHGPHPSSQCSDQAQNNTTIYTLYYPDATPDNFSDDVLAAQWTVAPSPISGTLASGDPAPSYVFSDTWVNFNNVPQPGYLISPISSYNIWHLNVSTPANDNSNAGRGSVGQNQFAIRLKTSYAGVAVYAAHHLPATNVLANSNQTQSSVFYLGDIGSQYAGRRINVNLFDPGDFSGPSLISLISPITATGAVTFHVTTHGTTTPRNLTPPASIPLVAVMVATTTSG